MGRGFGFGVVIWQVYQGARGILFTIRFGASFSYGAGWRTKGWRLRLDQSKVQQRVVRNSNEMERESSVEERNFHRGVLREQGILGNFFSGFPFHCTKREIRGEIPRKTCRICSQSSLTSEICTDCKTLGDLSESLGYRFDWSGVC